MGKFNCLESRQTKLFKAYQFPVKNKIKYVYRTTLLPPPQLLQVCEVQ